MGEDTRKMLWARFMEMDGTEIDLEVHRDGIQPGRTFSAEAMEMLHDEMLVWVGTRIMQRWEATNEPPTVVRVSVSVAVQ